MSKIEVNTVDTQCGSTLTLGSSGKTVTLASGASQSGFGRTGTVDWCTTAKTSPFTAVSGDGFFVNTTSGAITVTLPASPSAGDIVAFADYASTWCSNAVTICRNSSLINGGTFNPTLAVKGQSVSLVYVDGTRGWKTVTDSTADVTGAPNYVTATGGTIVTVGDFKTHIFTADGCFAVSAGGTPSGSNTVDYFVVGGGGSSTPGTSGGGGGGGFRLRSSAPGSTSPLNAPAGLPVSVQTYPITVGGGGAVDANGGNSTFSTITSAGGGTQKAAGGSGGGGFGNDVEGPTSTFNPGGAGNTPPVSPPQGNAGGPGNRSPNSPINRHGGGGGGAGAAGTAGTASPGTGGGGIGSYISDPFIGPTAPSYGTPGPESSTRYFSGGGGGGYDTRGASGPAGPGGSGGGGAGGSPSGTAGTTNTGGGAGGGTSPPAGTGQAGGSGIVMIRYKFQN